jgi:hypothetical protein
VGVATGVHHSGGRAYNAVGVTEDFAARDLQRTGAFLTGVAYRDANANPFYTPGEGLAAVKITAKRTTDGATFSTTTWSAGGYTLKLAPGTYKVTASGPAFATPTAATQVTIKSRNVKVDFDPKSATPVTVRTAATVSPGTPVTATSTVPRIARTTPAIRAFASSPLSVLRATA